MRPHEEEMIKKGEEVKVDEKDKESYEEIQKLIDEQEQKQREENDGPNTLSAVGGVLRTLLVTRVRKF